MKYAWLLAPLLLAGWILLLSVLVLVGCSSDTPTTGDEYAVGEYVPVYSEDAPQYTAGCGFSNPQPWGYAGGVFFDFPVFTCENDSLFLYFNPQAKGDYTSEEIDIWTYYLYSDSGIVWGRANGADGTLDWSRYYAADNGDITTVKYALTILKMTDGETYWNCRNVSNVYIPSGCASGYGDANYKFPEFEE